MMQQASWYTFTGVFTGILTWNRVLLGIPYALLLILLADNQDTNFGRVREIKLNPLSVGLSTSST